MKKILTFILLFLLVSNSSLYSQVIFRLIQGSKANYSISIPNNYYLKESIGANVDLKYVNSEGASIITVIRNLPEGVIESDINQMSVPSDQEIINIHESNGLENISIIKRGFIIINGVRSYITYYRSTDLYYHSITQFRKGKIILLTYTCEFSKKDLYMPYIYRVVNSLRS